MGRKLLLIFYAMVAIVFGTSGLPFSQLPTLDIPAASASTKQILSNSSSSIGSCPLFPSNNIWNYDISQLPVDPNSANYIASIGLTGQLHGYFGAQVKGYAPPGIPYVIVPGTQPFVPVHFAYANESDPGPYPIPPNAPIEGGPNSNGDRHVIVVDRGTCKLYEMFNSFLQKDGSWNASSGAVWNLRSNQLRPEYWTSADAAGLPILAGLARYDEVTSGIITHALRFTVTSSQDSFLWPVRHFASSNSNPDLPPMGLRLRLKASVNISSFPPESRVILTALQHYGMFVADNGPNSWVVSGAPDKRWNNVDLSSLGNIHGSDFEVVNESALQVSPDSGQAGSQGHASASTSGQENNAVTPPIRMATVCCRFDPLAVLPDSYRVL